MAAAAERCHVDLALCFDVALVDLRPEADRLLCPVNEEVVVQKNQVQSVSRGLKYDFTAVYNAVSILKAAVFAMRACSLNSFFKFKPYLWILHL